MWNSGDGRFRRAPFVTRPVVALDSGQISGLVYII